MRSSMERVSECNFTCFAFADVGYDTNAGKMLLQTTREEKERKCEKQKLKATQAHTATYAKADTTDADAETETQTDAYTDTDADTDTDTDTHNTNAVWAVIDSQEAPGSLSSYVSFSPQTA